MTELCAELATSHNWDLGRAKVLIQKSAHYGADLVKFQCHVGNYLKPDAPDFGPNLWPVLEATCNDYRVEFFCSPFSLQAARLMDPLVKRWKVAAGQVTNLPMLRFMKKTGKQVYVSTGLATEEEIYEANQVLGSQALWIDCVSIYPTPPKYWHHAMWAGAGLSDHSGTPIPGILAAFEDVPYIEVHVKDEWSIGPDVAASVTFEELALIRRAIASQQMMDFELVPQDHLNTMRQKYMWRPE